jgi:hypothetical protein
MVMELDQEVDPARRADPFDRLLAPARLQGIVSEAGWGVKDHGTPSRQADAMEDPPPVEGAVDEPIDFREADGDQSLVAGPDQLVLLEGPQHVRARDKKTIENEDVATDGHIAE